MGNKNSRGANKSNKDGVRNNKKVPEDKEALSAEETTDVDNISDITCIKPYVPEISFADYSFPFENLVFEGGGSKVLAFCGAVRVLEENALWPQVRRLAGTSSGGMVAALLAVGYSSHDIETFLNSNMKKVMLDHTCGYGSLFPNLMRHYGWNPGKRLLGWFGSKLQQATGSADITFQEVYQRFGKELCIVVTNLNQMTTEYCHHKTTPDMPIRIAVRMSMSIPGTFQPVRYKNNQQVDFYVDGGLLCNYPIHCFDGWWLSGRPDDSFIQRLQPMRNLARVKDNQERFGSYNEKTLGFLLFSEWEQELLQVHLEDRDGKQLPLDAPMTKLAKKRLSKMEGFTLSAQKHDAVAMAAQKLLQALRMSDLDTRPTITSEEFETAVTKGEEVTKDELEVIFGNNVPVKDAYKQILKKNQDELTFKDIDQFLQQKLVGMQGDVTSFKRKQVRNLKDFVIAAQESLHQQATRNLLQERDVERTVGINTYYMGTADFKMEADDRSLLVEQGKRAMRAYLEYYITRFKPALKTENRVSFFCDDIKYFVDDDAMTEIIDEKDYMENFLGRKL